MDVRVGARDGVDVAREDEPDRDHQILPLRGEQAERGLAVLAPHRLEKAHPCAELSLRSRQPLVCRIVEALVSAAPDVENEAYPRSAPFGARRDRYVAGGQERHQDASEHEGDGTRHGIDREHLSAGR